MKKLLMMFLITISSTTNGQPKIQTNLDEARYAAHKDVVAQALNYITGYKDEPTGNTFYFPKERRNGNCIFEKTNDARNIVDFNKGNPDTIEINIVNSGGDGFHTPYYDSIVSKVEGLGTFQCGPNNSKPFNIPDVCNIQRVRRAWALIYRECKGTRKAF